ncbi:50S ribosomal protein L32 [bacterium]|nr:50S ribosomal protein L32 [bacterium]MCI0680054.1 50S ribosomal protein L32 [bacterium]
MRHTKSHTANRRSHHAIAGVRLSACNHCGKPHISHAMCERCGTYRGRQIVDIMKKRMRTEERAKRKRKELGMEPNKREEKDAETKPLDPVALSRKK